jgi:hypothetical protein
VGITNLVVSPGDLVALVICTPSGAGSTSAQFFFSNTTSGHSTSYEVSIPEGSFVGDQAEWIVELPSIVSNNKPVPVNVPDYGIIYFSSAVAGLASGGVVNAGATGGRNGGFNMSINGVTSSTGAVIGQTVVQCQYAGAEPNANTSGLIAT